MTIADNEQVLLKKWRSLPPDKQQEMLDFADFLEHRGSQKRPRRSLLGLAEDLGVTISDEEITQARREMWGDFPKDFP